MVIRVELMILGVKQDIIIDRYFVSCAKWIHIPPNPISIQIAKLRNISFIAPS